jgi:hypothetical protein
MKKLFPLILLVLLCSGCATIISGNQNQVTIKTDVPAEIIIVDKYTKNIVATGNSPMTLMLKTYAGGGAGPKGAASYAVLLSNSEGYGHFFNIDANINPWIWGNTVIFFGYGFDEISGAAYKLEKEYFFKMPPKNVLWKNKDLIRYFLGGRSEKTSQQNKPMDFQVQKSNIASEEHLQIKHNAYGPGIHSNQYGQPVKWEVQGHHQVPGEYLQVKPNAYGPGIGMDQYGRPVKAVPALKVI